jgi:hypothetical protein
MHLKRNVGGAAMSTSEQSMEHRWGARVPMHEAAALRGPGGEESHALLRDASLSGAFVDTDLRPALLSRIAIRPLEDAGDWIGAWVVRTDERGIGLEWLEPASRDVVALLSSARGAGKRRPKAEQSERPASEMAIQSDSLLRAYSEVDSEEFDVQG